MRAKQFVSLRGRRYEVLALTPDEVALVDRIRNRRISDPEANSPELWSCVRRIVPTMRASVFNSLTLAAVGQILAIGRVRAGMNSPTDGLVS